MKVRDLIKSLADFNLDDEVYLDTDEGMTLIKLDDVYTNDSGKVIAYGSVFNKDNDDV